MTSIWTPRIVAARTLAESGRLPRGYGIAWALPYTHRYYCLPIPLNFVAGWVRNAYLRLTRGGRDLLAEARSAGYNEGYTGGYEHGRTAGERLHEIVREASPPKVKAKP